MAADMSRAAMASLMADLERDIHPLVYRYLGRNDGDRYIHETYPDPEAPGEWLVQVKPDQWYSSF